MAHCAEIDSTGVVLRVIVVDDAVDAEAWCSERFGGTWRSTSYNTYGGQHPQGRPFRKNFAGIGYTYDEARDAFIPPKPFPSWTLNEETCLWDAPVAYPGGMCAWDENRQEWVSGV